MPLESTQHLALHERLTLIENHTLLLRVCPFSEKATRQQHYDYILNAIREIRILMQRHQQRKETY